MLVSGIDHVQIAAPGGCEADARNFFGRLLGLEEIEKPEPLRSRDGCWFRVGASLTLCCCNRGPKAYERKIDHDSVAEQGNSKGRLNRAAV
jgi:hypothetical protein